MIAQTCLRRLQSSLYICIYVFCLISTSDKRQFLLGNVFLAELYRLSRWCINIYQFTVHSLCSWKSNKISTLSLRRMCAGVEKFPNILRVLRERTFSKLQASSSITSRWRSVCREHPPRMENNSPVQSKSILDDRGSPRKISREIFLSDFARRLSQPAVIGLHYSIS